MCIEFLLLIRSYFKNLYYIYPFISILVCSCAFGPKLHRRLCRHFPFPFLAVRWMGGCGHWWLPTNPVWPTGLYALRQHQWVLDRAFWKGLCQTARKLWSPQRWHHYGGYGRLYRRLHRNVQFERRWLSQRYHDHNAKGNIFTQDLKLYRRYNRKGNLLFLVTYRKKGWWCDF